MGSKRISTGQYFLTIGLTIFQACGKHCPGPHIRDVPDNCKKERDMVNFRIFL
jgi:hypothetical protein